MQRSQQSLLDPSKIAALGQKGVTPQQQRSMQQQQVGINNYFSLNDLFAN